MPPTQRPTKGSAIRPDRGRHIRLAARGFAFPLVVALTWGVPVAIALFARPGETERAALSPPDSAMTTAVVGERYDDGAQPASLTLVWAPAASARWPVGIDGVITDVFLQPGAVVEDGSPIAAVDGITRIAQVSGRPLYRDIRVGDIGPDVQWLDGLLIKFGVTSEPTLDSRPRDFCNGRGVRDLQERLGAPRDGTFRANYTVWAGATTVGTVGATVGDRTAAGAPIFEEAPQLASAALHLSAPPSRQSILNDVPVELLAGSTVVPLSGLSLDADDLHRLARTYTPLTTQDDSVSIRRRNAFHPGTAPSSALVPLSSTQVCVVVESAPGDYEPVRFEPIPIDSTEPGVSYVPLDLAGSAVVTNVTPSMASLCSSSG